MKDELHCMKNKILGFYPFKENKDGELFCMLEDRSMVVFRFFQKGNTVDLLKRKFIPFGGYKEEALVLSLSINDKEDIQTLNESIKNRLII